MHFKLVIMPKRVLVQVKPMMHESIQEEIEKVSLLLEGGTTMHRAFRGFNETFNFRELVFFHEMLEVCSQEGGAKFGASLTGYCRRFSKNKKLYLARLRSSLSQAQRAFCTELLNRYRHADFDNADVKRSIWIFSRFYDGEKSH